MLDIFRKWYKRYLSEEESVLLLVLLTVSVMLLMTIGDILAPVLAAIVLAYLAQGLASLLQRYGVPQWLGVAVSYLVFIGFFFSFVFALLPLAWRQMLSLASELPSMMQRGQELLSVLPQRYPQFVSDAQIGELQSFVQAELAGLGPSLVTGSLAWIPSVLTVMVYIILIPLLVFFFLKDRQPIFDWFGSFLPTERPFLRRIWMEMDEQVANYARGKVLEILIIGSVTYFAFAWLGLQYAALLGLLVGLSVIIPYIGATIVTLPVALVAYFQWGLTSDFYYLIAVYLVIQVLDGNVLVPLLFSEAVNLHPVAIILAVLFFGGIWGLWGVFFAIPLATLIKAIINAWPRSTEVSAEAA
ncbi:MAG: AI-2E family transporter [Halioglobus sp.]|nr:AI-2E family transporter [Halioglobus sp.]